MAISFKEKLAYINKYAKGNDKLVKAVQLGKALEKVKDDTQREKIKKAVNDAFTQIKKINTASSTKTSTAKTAQTKQDKIEKEIEKFKKSIGRSKWITATRYMTNSGLRKTTIEKDAQVPALPKGKRISRKTGKPYWENRANRSDVKQPPVDYPKLARGGYIEIDKLYFIGTPEVTSVDKNGRKSGDWKYIVVDKNGNKTESILKMKFNEDPKDVRTNTENAEYVTQQQFDRMYDKMKGKMAKGGEVESTIDILMTEEPKVWDKFGFNSGSEIRASKDKTKKYAQELERVFTAKGIKKGSLTKKINEDLTDENYHLLNEFLTRNGYFNSKLTDELLKSYNNPVYSGAYADKESITIEAKAKPKSSGAKKIQRKKLSAKTTYIPNREIEEVDLKSGKKIAGSDIVDGVYKKK